MQTGCPVDVLLRPDDILHDDASTLQAEVAKKAFRGADILYTLQLPSGRKVLSLVPSHHNHAIGGKIGIRLAVDHVVTFKQNPALVTQGSGLKTCSPKTSQFSLGAGFTLVLGLMAPLR